MDKSILLLQHKWFVQHLYKLVEICNIANFYFCGFTSFVVKIKQNKSKQSWISLKLFQNDFLIFQKICSAADLYNHFSIISKQFQIQSKFVKEVPEKPV